jgi:nicotinamidase-related amidase
VNGQESDVPDVAPDPARRKADRLAQLVTPATSAVLIQEMQQGVVGTASGLPALAEAGASIGLIEKVAAVVQAARAAGVRVVHCTAENLPGEFGVNQNARVFGAARKAGLENAPGSESVRPVPDVGPELGDVVLPRYHGLSPMTGSPLDSLLRNDGVTTVVVVGVSLNVAIPNLVFDAVNRSYQVVVVSDAVVGIPVEYGDQVLVHTLSLVATVASTDEVVEAWTKRETEVVE